MRKIICVILFVAPFLSFGQNQNQEQNLFNWFDEKIGFENLDLHQGKQYKKKYRPINGKHSFFKNAEFVKGSIAYKKEQYSNLYLKYDLFAQELIIRFQRANSTGVTIQLFKNNVKRFTLHNTQFVKVEAKDVNGKPISGFYQEVVASPNLKLLIKHSKRKKEVPYRGRMLVAYRKNKSDYYIFYKNQYVKIKSKRTLLKTLPSFKKEIHAFYKAHSSLRKTNYTLFLSELLKHLETNKNL